MAGVCRHDFFYVRSNARQCAIVHKINVVGNDYAGNDGAE